VLRMVAWCQCHQCVWIEPIAHLGASTKVLCGRFACDDFAQCNAEREHVDLMRVLLAEKNLGCHPVFGATERVALGLGAVQ
jgi:hypothetical protein